MRLLGGGLLMVGLAATHMPYAASAQQFEIPASAKAAIVEETNAYRQTKGLPPLRENWHASWTRPSPASPQAAVAAAMTFWKHSPGHERALRSNSTKIGVGMAGWRHGNQWYYQEIQVFIDTSCPKSVQTASNDTANDDQAPPLPERKPMPPRPDRNPSRP